MIRRAEHRGPRDIVIGVELLGSGAKPAQLRLDTELLSETGGSPVVHFAHSAALGGAAVLCRSGRLREGGQVVIDLQGQTGVHQVGAVVAAGASLELGALQPAS